MCEGLQRAAPRRDDAQWIDRCRETSSGYLLPVHRNKNLVVRDNERVTAVRVRVDALGDPLTAGEQTVFLGVHAETCYFALSVSGDNPSLLAEMAERGEFVDLRRVGPSLDEFDVALLAYARAMIYWHERYRFCGVCGASTNCDRAGHARVCSDDHCGAVFFPRTDPAVIVLVYADRGACLLGRQSSWPVSMYSTIAGFVEPGEALEQAVVREVDEETGIRIDRVQYHSSQPWPFPSSVMTGFLARAVSLTIDRRDGELEDVGWFTRREVGNALRGGGRLCVPPALSIARRLIEDWYRGVPV